MRYMATSGILYVRASLRPFARQIRSAGSITAFLRQVFPHEEVFAPHFQGARPFWRRAPTSFAGTNSGALGRLLAAEPGAVLSAHPSHRFVGLGPRVSEVLAEHDYKTSCFHPVNVLSARDDFSMLLLGCVEDSPGFSTVHAVQYELGLTRKHVIRHLLRWDLQCAQGMQSITAQEAPGCSLSFDKFYPTYASDGNFVAAELDGRKFLFVQSARRAMAGEREILSRNPRFVECNRLTCTTCRLRLY